jgi:hypothetical protein
MRKVCLVVALGLAAGLIAAGCGDDDDDGGESQTLDLLSVEQPALAGEIKVGGPGDGFLIADELQENGDAVGSTWGVCTYIGGDGRPEGADCEINLDLTDRGTLAVQGLLKFDSDTFDAAIIGGTGDYAGANGTLTADISNDKETPITAEFTTESSDD